MNDPEEIKINADVRIASKIEEYCYYPSDDEKPRLLVNLLNHDDPERVLVFINTRHGVEQVANLLSANNISVAALSGDVHQRKREKLLEGFKTGKYKVLVATDVAARGLHIPEVSHVYNYDLPQDADDYVHRIGRTARAGNSGKAVSFLCEKYSWSIMDIESSIGHSIPKNPIEPWMIEQVETSARPTRKRDSDKKKKSEKSAKDKPSDKKKSKKQPGKSPNHSPLDGKPLQAEAKTDTTEEYRHPDHSPFEEESKKPSHKEKTNAPAKASPSNHSPSRGESKKTSQRQNHSPLEGESAGQGRQPAGATVGGRPAPSPPENRYSRRFGEIPMIG